MDTDFLYRCDDLQQELDDAKHTLVTLNDNIRRIIGRGPRVDKHKSLHDVKRNDADMLKYKRRSNETKSVFNRLSAPAPRSPDEESRPRLFSRVIRELPTREDILTAQGTDSESRARNRRMFGSLLGTLQKFCQEESRLKQKEEKKAQIEKKLEEQAVQEREFMKKQRESLFQDRKRKQFEIRMLELKMHRLKDFEVWENSMKPLKHHIVTNTKPHLYFKPRIMTKKTEKLLSDSKVALENTIEKKREAVQKELQDLESSLKGCDFEMDEHMESIKNNEDDFSEDKNRNLEFELKVETPYTVASSIKKADSDSKENKVKNSDELSPNLNSSIVIVVNTQSDQTNKP